MAAPAFPSVGAAEDRHTLWRIVHDLCATDMRLFGRPAPCSKVDLTHGYAILKDPQSPTQLLLVPTNRVTGIEDARLLAPAAPNYWRLAWENRPLLDRRAHRALPREAVALAVNSIYGRSQGQLHIHLDCVRAEVADQLSAHRQEIGVAWQRLDVELAGARYAARWLPEVELEHADPFQLLAETPAGRADMGRQTLVMVGSTSEAGEPGFVLLNGEANLQASDRGHGEDLLDHGCQSTARIAADAATAERP